MNDKIEDMSIEEQREFVVNDIRKMWEKMFTDPEEREESRKRMAAFLKDDIAARIPDVDLTKNGPGPRDRPRAWPRA